MHFEINFYTDFNTDLLRQILLVKYKKNSLSCDTNLNRLPFFNVEISDGGICVIWVSVESFKNTYFLNKLGMSSLEQEDLLKDSVFKFLADVRAIAGKYKQTIICSFNSIREGRGSGSGNYLSNGNAYIITYLNYNLANLANKNQSIYLLDVQSWKDQVSNSLDEKNWYLTKNPFSRKFLNLAASELSHHLDLINKGRSIKVILLDLDNTIWGGEAGESNISEIRIGGHDYVGEAFAEFQRTLLKLNQQGILIALVSKNSEEIAMAVFDNHPEMILARKNISAMRINWDEKHLNIIKIMNDLNLGLNSAIFIDDNQVERASIKANLPEVQVLDLPPDPCLYCKTLNSIKCFDLIDTTVEDQNRSISYQENILRKKNKSQHSDKESWLMALETKIYIENISNNNINRYVQLLNKTNQFNAKTRRMNKNDFETWLNQEGHNAWSFRLEDKYGKMGIIGLLSSVIKDDFLNIEDYVLSCRSANRGVEECMLSFICEHAMKKKCKNIFLQAKQTERNKPMLDFLNNQNHLIKIGSNLFSINLSKSIISNPKYISTYLTDL
ncbi:HAD-IIIC family phosphatase [Prochlorococcus sp. MIT 1011]|uniref:HAD-IIIC family phosphatase n=1 Tax=Prochlorococcus sp. MIT 1011 TaxID=3082520 RepID=UPI0039B60A5F